MISASILHMASAAGVNIGKDLTLDVSVPLAYCVTTWCCTLRVRHTVPKRDTDSVCISRVCDGFNIISSPDSALDWYRQ